MNTESAAICCGNRPSTPRSGRPVLVCMSCGDQLQGETEAATIAAWNRAKSPAVTTTEAQRQAAELRIAELEGEVSDGIDERDKLSRQLQRARALLQRWLDDSDDSGCCVRELVPETKAFLAPMSAQEAEHIYCGQGQKPARPLIKPGNYRSSESVVQALFDDMADRHGFADVLEEISNETAEQVRLAWANILSEDAAHADESRRAEIESDVSKIWQKRTETAYKDALAKVLAGHANGRSLCERAKDTIDALRGDLQASNSQLFDACTARDGLEAELSELRGQDRSKCAEDVRNFSDASDSLTRTVAKLTDELTETQSRADANWHEGERLRGELAKADRSTSIRLLLETAQALQIAKNEGFVGPDRARDIFNAALEYYRPNPQANPQAVTHE